MLSKLPIPSVLIGLVLGCATPGTPRRADAGSAPVAQIYRSVQGQTLRAFVFEPPGSSRRTRPALLFFHGGGWTAGNAEWTFDTARRFARQGVVAIAVDYRLSDDETTPVEALDDACAAFAWARRNAHELRIDPRRVGGYGVSAGGHLVAAAATRGCGGSAGSQANGGPDALLLWSPALDVGRDGWFRRLLRGRGAPEAYSPVDTAPARLPPISIVQGAEDTLTPLSGARRFCEQARAHGNVCDLHVYPALGHLLTRNLQNQESDYDPDPVAREDGLTRQERFLRELWR